MELVHQIALRVHRRLPASVELDDLEQAGTLGLMDALSMTDRSGRECSPAYLRLRVQGAILDSLRQYDWASRYMRDRGRKLRDAENELHHQLGKAPTSEEIAERMGLDLHSYFEFAAAVRSPLQVVSTKDQDDNEQPILDTLSSPAEFRPDALFEQQETRRSLLTGASNLHPAQCCVLLLYYFAEWTGAQIACALHLSEARVSQLRLEALAGLRPGSIHPAKSAGTPAVDRATSKEYKSEQGGSASIIGALLDILAQSEPQVLEHSRRVHAYTQHLALRVGYPASDMSRLLDAALLHDLGSLFVPTTVLGKAGQLDTLERRQVQKHAEAGSRILERIPDLAPLAEIVRYHHEHFDGTGYPEGLKGEQIPLGARIIAVAGALDAMTSTRSYQRVMDFASAQRTIASRLSTQFDPRIGAACLLIPPEEWEQLRARTEEQKPASNKANKPCLVA
jgi:RNA polymerase sigma factor (sigma-70 family)